MTSPSIYILMLLSSITQCFCLEPITFGQVWDLPGLSTVVLEDRFLLAVQNTTLGRGREVFILYRINSSHLIGA